MGEGGRTFPQTSRSSANESFPESAELGVFEPALWAAARRSEPAGGAGLQRVPVIWCQAWRPSNHVAH